MRFIEQFSVRENRKATLRKSIDNQYPKIRAHRDKIGDRLLDDLASGKITRAEFDRKIREADDAFFNELNKFVYDFRSQYIRIN